jgi:hypothetical protein
MALAVLAFVALVADPDMLMPYVPDNRALGTVPLAKLFALRFVKLAPETAPKLPDQVPDVTVPVVVKKAEPASGEAPIVL